MEINEDMARLEQLVEKLIESHNKLKSENIEIYEQLQTKQLEIDDLQELILNLQEDRNTMHDRVSGLIDRIDEWEKVIDKNDSELKHGSADNKKKNLTKKSSLFKVTQEQSSESALR